MRDRGCVLFRAIGDPGFRDGGFATGQSIDDGGGYDLTAYGGASGGKLTTAVIPLLTDNNNNYQQAITTINTTGTDTYLTGPRPLAVPINPTGPPPDERTQGLLVRTGKEFGILRVQRPKDLPLNVPYTATVRIDDAGIGGVAGGGMITLAPGVAQGRLQLNLVEYGTPLYTVNGSGGGFTFVGSEP